MTFVQKLWVFVVAEILWVACAVIEHFKHGSVYLSTWIGIAILFVGIIATLIKHRATQPLQR
jgi:hypothetical protein